MVRHALAALVASCLALSPPASAQKVYGSPSQTGAVHQTTEGSAWVNSQSLSVNVPASGVITIDPMLISMHRVALAHLALDIQTDLPLGLVQVSLPNRTILYVQGQQAYGNVVLDVYLPTYDTTYTIQTQAILQLYPTPALSLPFGLLPDQLGLDPVYTFEVSAMFEQGGVLCQDIDKLIKDLDDDDPAVRERATRDLIALGERAIKKVKDALAGGGLSAEQRARLEYILPRLLVVTLATDPEWEGPQDAGQWNFAFFVYASVPDICDIHFMVGYPPGGGEPQAGYDPASADIQLVGFPDGWSGSYDKDTGEIVVECGGLEDIPLDAGSDYEIKISTPTMGKKDPKPVGWHYTDSDGHKIGEPGTKGTIDKGPRF